MIGLRNLTIQLCQKALPEAVVPVPKQRLPDCEEWRVLALKPQLCKADLLLPVSPVLVWHVQLSAGYVRLMGPEVVAVARVAWSFVSKLGF